MSTRTRIALILTLALLGGATLVGASPATPAQGGAPTVVAYQGEVRLDGTPYTGDAYVKFAVVNTAADTTYWSNDGTSANGGQPSAAVPLAVSHGLFSVLLGDTTLGSGMTEPLTADVFDEPDRTLRVWFSTSGGGPFSPLDPDTRIAAVPYALQAQEAGNADTVDGLHAHELGTHYQNVVVVAKSGGDYTAVQAAIDSITDATAGNPYLVWVAPGVYSETVTMKPYVHVQGAGQEATVIHSSASGDQLWPPTHGTLELASDSSLRDLTVDNAGAGGGNAALLATSGAARTLVADVTARAQGSGLVNGAFVLNGSGTGVTLQQVTALGENGSARNYGLSIHNGASATLRGGSFTARGGMQAHGIYNRGSGTTLEAENVTAQGENGNHYSDGLRNDEAAATVRSGSFTGRGGTYAYGIQNYGSDATLEAEDVTALGENGSWNHGLLNWVGAATLRGGSFTGRGGTDAYGIQNHDSGTTLEAEDVTALGEDSTDSNYGLYNDRGAAATVRGGAFTGRGGTYALGIRNEGSGTTLEAESVTALAEDGTVGNYGLYNGEGGAATVRGGAFTGREGTYALGIRNEGSGTTLEAESVTALGGDGSDRNYGLSVYDGAAATLQGGSFTGRGGDYARGISNSGSGTTLEADSVTALAEDGTVSNYGLYNQDSAVATLRGGSFTGRGGTNAQGIFNDGDGTTLEAQDVTALGENGSTNNHGLYNGSGAAVAILRGGSFTGRGGTDAGGIFNSFTLEAERVTVLGENGSHSSLGLHNTGTASVAQSVLEGSTNSVYCGGTSSATVTVSNSRLVGGWVYGTVTCVAVSQDFSFYQSGCP